jgi:uncharacterized protein YndB with AHSA1/START domain
MVVMENTIMVESEIGAPVGKVWELFTQPHHIMNWNHASDDWHSPSAINDLREGGRFNYRMEAKDGSAGFDFTGVYTEVFPEQRIAYTMDDGRTAVIDFQDLGNTTKLVTTFEPEKENTLELQRSGWQAILDNFKRYVENN